MSRSATLGLVSGLAIIVVTLVLVALVNLPEAEGAVNGGRDRGVDCRSAQAAQDQGYGLTRRVQGDGCDLAR